MIRFFPKPFSLSPARLSPVMLLLMVCPLHRSHAGPITPGNVTISPSEPDASWTAERALYPGETVRFNVTVEESGEVGGKSYELQGEATVNFDIGSPGILWTRVSASGYSFDALNNGGSPVTETAEVSAVWEETTGDGDGGQGGGGSSNTINGLATGTAYTERLKFTWYFDHRLVFADGQSAITYTAAPAADGASVDLAGYTVESEQAGWQIQADAAVQGAPLTGKVKSSEAGKGVLKVVFNGDEQDRSEDEIAFVKMDLAISSIASGANLPEDRVPGGVGPPPPANELTPGGVVIPPTQGVAGSAGIRTRITLKASGISPDEGTYTLEANGLDRLLIYAAAQGGAPIAQREWDAEDFPTTKTLYLGSEPHGPDDQPQQGTLKLTYKRPLESGGGLHEIQDTVGVSLLPVEIKEVSFDGTKYWELKSDDAATTYSAPQWKDVDGNGSPTNTAQGEHDYAVAFTRNTKPKIGAKFKIANASNLGAIKIKATGPGGIAIPETAATVSGDEVTLPSLTEASSALVNTIKFYDKKDDATAFKLEWEIKVGTADWSKIGTTKHTVYVTLDDPITSLRQETLFEIGSRRADGETEAAQARTKAYAEFQTRSIKRVNDQTPLKYWANPPEVGGVTTTELLAHPDGDGNCNGWSQFFRDILRVQGIEANMVVVIPIIVETVLFLTPDSAKIVAVKEWTFLGEGTGTVDYPYISGVDAIPGSGGTAGQNNPSPPKSFNLHYVTLSGATIYDSSYGTPPVGTTIKAYEDAAFAGFGKKAVHNGVFRSLIAVNHDGTISPAEVQILEVPNE